MTQGPADSGKDTWSGRNSQDKNSQGQRDKGQITHGICLYSIWWAATRCAQNV